MPSTTFEVKKKGNIIVKCKTHSRKHKDWFCYGCDKYFNHLIEIEDDFFECFFCQKCFKEYLNEEPLSDETKRDIESDLMMMYM